MLEDSKYVVGKVEQQPQWRGVGMVAGSAPQVQIALKLEWGLERAPEWEQVAVSGVLRTSQHWRPRSGVAVLVNNEEKVLGEVRVLR